MENLNTRIDLVAAEKAFIKLKLFYNKSKAPLSGFKLASPTDYDGNTITLDEHGSADFYVRGSPDALTFSLEPYADVSWRKTVVCMSGSIVVINESVTTVKYPTYTASTSIRLSKNVLTLSAAVASGGNGGNGAYYKAEYAVSEYDVPGKGGNGGGYVSADNISFEIDKTYNISVGSGGAGGTSTSTQNGTLGTTYGKYGGISSFMNLTAQPGGGGTGGAGASITSDATKGSNSSQIFSLCGGGGGGGLVYFSVSGNGSATSSPNKPGSSGTSGGGSGSFPEGTVNITTGAITFLYTTSSPGSNGTGGGGGGGSITKYRSLYSETRTGYNGYNGAAGGSGRVSLTLTLANE